MTTELKRNPTQAALYSGSATGDIFKDEYLERIAQEKPRNATTLMTILGLKAADPTDSTVVKWYNYRYPWQTCDLASSNPLKTNRSLATNYTSAATAAGTTVYTGITDENADEFVERDTVLLLDSDESRAQVRAVITDKWLDGGTYCFALKLIEAAPFENTVYGVATVDKMIKIGDAQPEFSGWPDEAHYDPNQLVNHTQIFMTPVRISGTAQQQATRTNKFERDLRRAQMIHQMKLERSALFGQYYSDTGYNNMPRRFARGFLSAAAEYGTKLDFVNYSGNDSYKGKTFAEVGWDFMREVVDTYPLFYEGNYVGICGKTALRGVQETVEANSNINITPGESIFGLKVKNLIMPDGTEVKLIPYPDFNRDDVYSSTIFFLNPDDIYYAPLRNRATQFIESPDKMKAYAGAAWVDGTIQGYLTECTWTFDNPQHWMIVHGVGLTNTVT